MGLPVGQIMAEVEEMLGRDEGGIEDAVDDFGDVQVEIVEGDKEGSTWLIVNGVHICHKQVENVKHWFWRCEDFRRYKCPFKITATEIESQGGLQG